MKRNLRVARHEAAHAVMGICYGLKVIEMGLDPGYASFDLSYDEMIDQLPAWKTMSITISGMMADHKYYSGELHGMDLNVLNRGSAERNTDSGRLNEICQMIPISHRANIIQKAMNYTESRLCMNWHHLEALANKLYSATKLNKNQVEIWFNRCTTYDEFHY